MRVVFFGTPQFAVPSLSALLDADVDVAAVVTQPDRPRGRSHSRLLPSPVKLVANAARVPVWQPEFPRGDVFYQQLRDARADLGVVVAYGHLLRRELLEIPRLGLVNVHASLLPRWRGAAPIQRAMLAGDPSTGVAIMRVEPGLDTGAVWTTASTLIEETDTAGSLTERLSTLGATLLVDTLPRVALGEVPTAQASDGVTSAPKVHRDDARIRWNEPAAAVSRRIRAMDPAPGAWTTLDGSEIKVFGANRVPDDADVAPGDPGAITVHDGRLVVATAAAGAVALAEVQPAGRRRMPAAEWLRGVQLAGGARLA